MIKTFDTSLSGTAMGSGTSATSGGSGKKIITIVVILAIAYLGYRFVLKPMLNKNSEEEK